MALRKTLSSLVFPGRRKPPPSPELGERYFLDLYDHLLSSSWPSLLLQILAVFLVLNTLFALAYLFNGGIDNARPGNFGDVFFFSVETMATIGYGRLSPITLPANILMSIEALTGLIGLAMMTGLTFAKFSRPSARVRYSQYAVVSMRDGVLSLMFRMANMRSSQIVEATVHVVFARQEQTTEGEGVRRFYDLRLIRYRNAIFNYSWTVVHPIDAESPLYGITPTMLKASFASLTVSVTGIDETVSQTVHSRHSYEAAEIIWGARMVDIITRSPDGEFMIDYTHFNDIVPVGLPPANQDGAMLPPPGMNE
ncbi:MAG TPA: ion channel [Candidatus Binataceae bacterium]|nr:ion channel [Candidatus Binataceae bacterium]